MRLLLKGLLLSLVAVMLPAAPASAAWLEAESPHFLVYSDGGEEELRAQVQLLEDYHRLLRALVPASDAQTGNKLRLYLVRSAAELRKVRNSGSGTSGFYIATSEGIAAFAIRKEDGTGFGAHDIIFHEYAHHFMLQNFAANYPSWYIEGFAEYLSTTAFTDSSIEIGRYNEVRASWLRDTWLPLDRILTSDSVPLDTSRDVARFYAQSWLMVHYLMREPERRAAMERYLRAFGAGEDPKTSFRTAFGKDAVEFTRALRGYGRDMTFTRMPRMGRSEPVAITVRRLPPSADDLLLYSAGLSLGSVDWGSYPLLPRVRNAARRHENDPMALAALARAELFYGDRARAEALLDKLLDVAPNDRDALYLRGLAFIYAGRADSANRATLFTEARPWLARAHKADENFYPALVRYAESFSVGPEYASENVGNILLLASQLAPQVNLIRLNTAQQQALLGHAETAKVLLAPVVNTAHSKRLREAARTLMTDIDAGKTPQAVFHVTKTEEDE